MDLEAVCVASETYSFIPRATGTVCNYSLDVGRWWSTSLCCCCCLLVCWNAISSSANWDLALKLSQNTNITLVIARKKVKSFLSLKKKKQRNKINIRQRCPEKLSFHSGNWNQSRRQDAIFFVTLTSCHLFGSGYHWKDWTHSDAGFIFSPFNWGNE